MPDEHAFQAGCLPRIVGKGSHRLSLQRATFEKKMTKKWVIKIEIEPSSIAEEGVGETVLRELSSLRLNEEEIHHLIHHGETTSEVTLRKKMSLPRQISLLSQKTKSAYCVTPADWRPPPTIPLHSGRCADSTGNRPCRSQRYGPDSSPTINNGSWSGTFA